MGRGSRTDTSSVTRSRPARPRSGERELLYRNLNRLGLDAWDVGGGPRDDEMGLDPKDRDIAVSGMTLAELKQRLEGEGKLTELLIVTDHDRQVIGYRLSAPWTPPEGVELALAREEVSTGPRHQDFEIAPIDPGVIDELIAAGMSREEAHREVMRRDAIRRDWTVNALMRNVRTGELVDFVGGLDDIRDRVLRPISADTCRDDPMRTLRGITRISKDDLTPTAEAEQQIREHSPRLAHLTQDKIFKELDKTLSGAQVGRALRFARDTGALAHALPEFAPCVGYEQRNPYHDLPVDEHSILAVQRAAELGAPRMVRWVMLLHDIGKPAMGWSEPGETRLRFSPRPGAGRFDPARFAHEEWSESLAAQALSRSQLGREFTGRVLTGVREHMFRDDEDFEARSAYRQRLIARRFIARVGRENAENLLLVRRCDRGAKNATARADYPQTTFERIVREQMSCPVQRGELAISGGELVQAGLRPGPEISAILDHMLQQVRETDDYAAANSRSGIPLAEAVGLIGDRAAFRKLTLVERRAVEGIAAAQAHAGQHTAAT